MSTCKFVKDVISRRKACDVAPTFASQSISTPHAPLLSACCREICTYVNRDENSALKVATFNFGE